MRMKGKDGTQQEGMNGKGSTVPLESILAAFIANCFLGALPPVLLRAVALYRTISASKPVCSMNVQELKSTEKEVWHHLYHK